MEEEPIYDFNRLKRFLESRGMHVGKAEAYRPIENVDVDINDLRNNIEFTNEGIFLKTPEGDKQQIFLYKRKYHLTKYRYKYKTENENYPRFHICRCKVIDDYINAGTFEIEYRRANSEPVNVIDMDNAYRERTISGMLLCQYCMKTLNNYTRRTSSDFVKILQEAKKEETTDVDMFGYTWDWDTISEAYREKKNYICEKCKIEVEPLDRFYIHVHHKDKDKTNNNESNLRCLCIRCHSRVDATHRKNFSKGGLKELLDEFNYIYPEEE
ncbi:MAG: HNH endonuclease [Bacteroides sp.]|nr:HNH endonuclease [Bacteroides sp.]